MHSKPSPDKYSAAAYERFLSPYGLSCFLITVIWSLQNTKQTPTLYAYLLLVATQTHAHQNFLPFDDTGIASGGITINS